MKYVRARSARYETRKYCTATQNQQLGDNRLGLKRAFALTLTLLVLLFVTLLLLFLSIQSIYYSDLVSMIMTDSLRVSSCCNLTFPHLRLLWFISIGSTAKDSLNTSCCLHDYLLTLFRNCNNLSIYNHQKRFTI